MEITPEVIDEILDEFDFERVHKVMVALNWEWCGEVPTIAELRREARRLLRDCANNEGSSLSCGGFCVDNQHGWLILSFQVAEVGVEYGL